MPTNKNAKAPGVSADTAAIIHELLSQCFESSLRQQLISGEFNAAMLGKILEWLKANNVSVTEDADAGLASIARAFRKLDDSSEESLEDMLAAMDSTTV